VFQQVDKDPKRSSEPQQIGANLQVFSRCIFFCLWYWRSFNGRFHFTGEHTNQEDQLTDEYTSQEDEKCINLRFFCLWFWILLMTGVLLQRKTHTKKMNTEAN